MKVCFFSGDITRSGGTERVSTVIANELVKDAQFDICFLSLWEKEKELFFYLDKKILRYTLFDNEVSGKRILNYIKKIRQFIKNNSIDIIVDIDGILDMYTIPASKKSDCKVISWEQFNYYQNPYVNYRKYTRKLAAKKADAVVVLTDEDKGYYQKELNVKCKLVRIYNPIENTQEKTNYDVESKIIISAGRLTEQKGFDILIDIANIAFDKHRDWKWVICGEGEDREKLTEKIKKYKLEKNVILEGNVANITDYYKKAAMFVLTSRYEGFGLVLTEAKNVGLPCVSFRCPCGPVEIIEDGVNGYLVDCFNVKNMAEKINELIENTEKRKEFSNMALVGTEKFDLSTISSQWKELLIDVMKEKKCGKGIEA